MSEQNPPPTQIELRGQLLDLVTKDLLGPAGGPEEEIDERNVRGRYLLGLLAPRGQTFDPAQMDALEVGGSDTEDGGADNVVPQSASMLPSSIGLSCTVDAAAEAIQVTAEWGRYERVDSDVLTREDGTPKLVWKRVPVKGVSDPIPLREGALGPWAPDPEIADVYVTGRCRRRDGGWSVTLFLVNGQEEPKKSRDTAWLFQPELAVTAPDLSPIFTRRLVGTPTSDHDEDARMQMLYRRQVEFAVGHGVGTHADLAEGLWNRAWRVATRVMPDYEVARMDPPTPEDIPALEDVVVDMKALAGLNQGAFTAALAPLADAYEAWIAAQERRLDQPTSDLAPYRTSGQAAMADARNALGRIRAGIALLDADPPAAQAFQFANRAMYLQRIRSIIAGLVRRGEKVDEQAVDLPRNRSWRPFQLAFLLLNLRGLADPTHDERNKLADLLWFPTGGGKTEAYLGVAAFTMGIRRLQGEMGGLSGHAGVTVLMRYTLRLLTLQQFQRAATLIAACEVIRRSEPIRWGIEPFRIGLWVGRRATPGYTAEAAEIVKMARSKAWIPGGGGGTPAQLTNCPWCGRPIDPGKDIAVELVKNGRGRTFQYCSDKYGRCPFSKKQAPDEGLPIVVVDEEIYRRLPTLLIATVDKFAQMPWKGETQMLFGRVQGYCPRHGYRGGDLEDTDSHPARPREGLPAVKTQPISRLRPPDLIIQDELHLISGPLGTLVGLYETAVDELCQWELDGQTVRPKVIASTATIRRAKEQVNNVFLRRVQLFPPSGLDADDNFFSRRRDSSADAPGRLYVGLSAPGVRLKTVLIRVYVAFMSAAQQLYEQYGELADPWMTTVGYFNSMRELGGMRRVADDAVRTRLLRMEERGLSKRYINIMDVEELTSRKSAGDIPVLLDRMEIPFNQQTVGSGGKGKSGKLDKKQRGYPLDILLATNMISVGVDVGRLGLMIAAGQPKATAEYIQATSRVGRRHPGIVCTVYNWARPRDLSHYERFAHYHATFYQQVEALSVTPFAPRAVDRGLTGVAVALVRLQDAQFNPNRTAGQLTQGHPHTTAAADTLAQRAAAITANTTVGDDVRARVKATIDAWLARTKIQQGSILGYKAKKDGRTVGLLHQPTEKDWDRFTCLNSLRDVEPGVTLVLNDHGMDREPPPRPANTPAGESS